MRSLSVEDYDKLLMLTSSVVGVRVLIYGPKQRDDHHQASLILQPLFNDRRLIANTSLVKASKKTIHMGSSLCYTLLV